VTDPECRICGSRRKVEEHHVNYIPEITVPLCRECHGRVHHGDEEDYRPRKHEERKRFLRGIEELLERYDLRASVYDAVSFVAEALACKQRAIEESWEESEASRTLDCLQEVGEDLVFDLMDMEESPKGVADTTGVEPFEKRASKGRSEGSGKNMRNDASEDPVFCTCRKNGLPRRRQMW